MMPDGWSSEKIGKYLKLLQERVPANTSYPVLTSSRQGLYRQDEYFSDKNLLNEGEYGVLPRGYITYRHMSDDLIFKFNINNLCDYGAISKEYPVFTITEKLDSYFLLMSLNHGQQFQKFAIEQQQGGTRTRLYFSKLQELRLILPPIEEQHKIAKILLAWDKAISTTEKLIETSQQQKKALMQQLLTEKKRLVNPDTGMEFEGDWEHGFLGNLCTFKGGAAFKEIYQGQANGDYPFIKVSDMNLPKNGKFVVEANNWLSIDVAKEIKVKTFDKGTVVFAKVGAALLLNRRRILVQPTIIDNNMMAATPNKKCHTEFLYQLMLMIDFAKLVQDGAVPSINQSDLSRFKISYPTLNEQRKIASVLTAADKEIELLEAKLAYLKDEKKALMQQLLTGKRRVKLDVTEAA